MGKRDAGTYGRRARSKIVRRGEAEEGEERREGGTEKGKDRLEHPEQPSPVLLPGALARVLLLDLVTLKLDERVEFLSDLRREGGERESKSASTLPISCGSNLFTSCRRREREKKLWERKRKQDAPTPTSASSLATPNASLRSGSPWRNGRFRSDQGRERDGCRGREGTVQEKGQYRSEAEEGRKRTDLVEELDEELDLRVATSHQHERREKEGRQKEDAR
jgi:hypothetical protein